MVYDELLQLAHRQRQRWVGDHTLTTTALVHELYLKLADQDQVSAQSRAHFYALAARAMRHILSNYARARRAQRRGGRLVSLPLDEARLLAVTDGVPNEDQAELIALIHDAVLRLEQNHERRGRVVECRLYGGMSIPDTATVLGISPATVKRDWAVAQAWLYRELKHATAD